MRNRTAVLCVFFLLGFAGCSRKEPEQSPKPPVRDEGTLVVKEPEQVLKPWVPDDGSFAVKVPEAPQERPLPTGARQYTFYGREKFAPMLLTVTVLRRVKDVPGLPDSPPPDVFYDQYEKAYRGAGHDITNIMTIKNGDYTGRQFEVPAGNYWPSMVVRLSLRNVMPIGWNGIPTSSTQPRLPTVL